MKLSRKFFTSLFASSILVTQTNALKADWDYWAVKANSNTSLGLDFFTVTGENNDTTNGKVDSSKVTANVVTFAGDVNYDGRVSLIDLEMDLFSENK